MKKTKNNNINFSFNLYLENHDTGIQTYILNLYDTNCCRDSIKIGVVGYSATDFSEEKARSLIKEGIQKIRSQHSGEPVIVSGLTYLGIPKLAYDFAENNHYST